MIMATSKKSKRVKIARNVVRNENAAQDDNGFGIASLILGISSILLPIIGIVTGILAIVFSAKQRKIHPNGTATAGLVLGIIGLAFQALVMMMIVAILAFVGMYAVGATAITV
jgi:hypothetical protein